MGLYWSVARVVQRMIVLDGSIPKTQRASVDSIGEREIATKSEGDTEHALAREEATTDPRRWAGWGGGPGSGQRSGYTAGM